MRTVYRWAMPIGESEIYAHWAGPVTRVESVGDDTVEFWAEVDETMPKTARSFLVLGTGHPMPDGWALAGTASRTPLGLVWHLLTRTEEDA